MEELQKLEEDIRATQQEEEQAMVMTVHKSLQLITHSQDTFKHHQKVLTERLTSQKQK